MRDERRLAAPVLPLSLEGVGERRRHPHPLPPPSEGEGWGEGVGAVKTVRVATAELLAEA
jgi:hypothetical protein